MDNAKDYPPYLDYPKERKKQTNADKIRQMTDEDFSEWIASSIDCYNCPHPRNGCTDSEQACALAWYKWLKQEVERDA